MSKHVSPNSRFENLMSKTEQKIVYVLGSGFSKDAGLPLMSKLNDRWTKTGELQAHPEIHKYYGKAANDVGKAWSLMIDDREILKTTCEENSLNTVNKLIKCTKDFLIRQFFKDEGNFKDSEKIYSKFLKKCVGEEASIVTTNWDLLLERVAFEQKIEWIYPGLEISQKHALKILKLHGSFNWVPIENYYEVLRCDPDLARKDKDGTISTSKRLSRRHESFFKEYKKIWKPFEPIAEWIIGPHMQKNYTIPPFDVLGQETLGVFKNATEIVVVGYSFPLEDRFFGSLFRRGLYDRKSTSKINVKIIDPCACNVEKNLSNIMGIGDHHIEIEKKCYSFRKWMLD